MTDISTVPHALMSIINLRHSHNWLCADFNYCCGGGKPHYKKPTPTPYLGCYQSL